jgi:hypothetical protein
MSTRPTATAFLIETYGRRLADAMAWTEWDLDVPPPRVGLEEAPRPVHGPRDEVRRAPLHDEGP